MMREQPSAIDSFGNGSSAAQLSVGTVRTALTPLTVLLFACAAHPSLDRPGENGSRAIRRPDSNRAAASSTSAPTADDAEVDAANAVWDRYMEAIVRGDGASVADVVTAGSVRQFEGYRGLALEVDDHHLEGLAAVDLLAVLVIRRAFDRTTLATTTAHDLMVRVLSHEPLRGTQPLPDCHVTRTLDGMAFGIISMPVDLARQDGFDDLPLSLHREDALLPIELEDGRWRINLRAIQDANAELLESLLHDKAASTGSSRIAAAQLWLQESGNVVPLP